jgi:hypothetical protein
VSAIPRPFLAGFFVLLFGLVDASQAATNYRSEFDVCRPARFWARRAGTENAGTDLVIRFGHDSDNCLTICGETLRDTNAVSADSMLEGLCTTRKAPLQAKLARELLAGALSCRSQHLDNDCLDLFDFCNTACTDPAETAEDRLCVGYLKCSTRGGYFDLDTKKCVVGTCSISHTYCGRNNTPCPDGETCEAFDNNCASHPIEFFDPEPAPSSAKTCRTARASSCTIVGPGETICTQGAKDVAVEVCPQESCDGHCSAAETSGGCGCDGESCGWRDGCLDRDTVCPGVCEDGGGPD